VLASIAHAWVSTQQMITLGIGVVAHLASKEIHISKMVAKVIISALLPLPSDLALSLILLSDVADINECLVPNKCKGVCYNTPGSYRCTACPDKTQYDMTTMQCTRTRRQSLMLGEVQSPIHS
jgi:hypothetical protein